MGKVALANTKVTKLMKKEIKSNTLETYLEKHNKPNSNLLELVGMARAPMSSVKMTSKILHYIDLPAQD